MANTTTPAGGGIGVYIDFAILAEHDGIADNVKNLVVSGGSWAVTWGPAWTLSDSNLAYAAEFTPTGATAPTIAAVVIRGTDAKVDPLGLLAQVAEDLRSLEQVTIPWSSDSSAAVSSGSIKAFGDITTMTSKGAMWGKNLSDYLTTVAGEVPQIVVTGHSLGGAMTTMVSLWGQSTFASALGSTVIQPVTFAAPGIGNQAFIDLYQSTFSGNVAFANSLDMVPLIWASPSAIPGLYTAYGLSTPSLVNGYLSQIQKWMTDNGVTYMQQSQNLTTLTGSFVQESGILAWADEVLAQHVATNYAALLANAGYTVPKTPF